MPLFIAEGVAADLNEIAVLEDALLHGDSADVDLGKGAQEHS